jgi:hypothetical protein
MIAGGTAPMPSTHADEPKPAPPAEPVRSLEPYRVLFPIGVAAALAGLLPWLVFAASLAPGWPTAWPIAWPAPRMPLMVQGFKRRSCAASAHRDAGVHARPALHAP